MALFKFTKAILNGQAIEVYNQGNMRRDFTYIDDIAEAVVRLCSVIPQTNPDWSVEMRLSGHQQRPLSGLQHRQQPACAAHHLHPGAGAGTGSASQDDAAAHAARGCAGMADTSALEGGDRLQTKEPDSAVDPIRSLVSQLLRLSPASVAEALLSRMLAKLEHTFH